MGRRLLVALALAASSATLATLAVVPVGPAASRPAPLEARHRPHPRAELVRLGPEAGPQSGGTVVTIRGRHLHQARAVRFGDRPATSFHVESGRRLVVTAPPAAGPGPVVVRLVGRGGARAGRLGFTYEAATPPPADPVVTSVYPSVGSRYGATTVFVAGAHLDAATEVTFDGVPAAFSQVSPWMHSVRAPTDAAGSDRTVQLRVTTPGGTSATGPATAFRYGGCTAPLLTSMTPSTGLVEGGTRLRLHDFTPSWVREVRFGDVPATAFGYEDGYLMATSPPHPLGPVPVTLVDGCGSSKPDPAVSFRYVPPPPTVSALSPAIGPTTGGTVVTLTGTNFVDVTGVHLSDDDETPVAAWRVLSPTRLEVTLPRWYWDQEWLVVETTGGRSAIAGCTCRFEFVPPPDVYQVTAPWGPPGGGTRVALRGLHFAGLGVDQVLFDGVPGTDVQVVSDTRLLVTAPPHAGDRVVDVRATNASGTSLRRRDAWFSYEAPVPVSGSAVQAPVPSDGVPGSAELSALACPAPSGCLATGHYTSLQGRELPLVEQMTPQGWVAGTVPLPPDVDPTYPFASLDTLSCVAADFCVAVGAYRYGESSPGAEDADTDPLLARWDGTTWTTTAMRVTGFVDFFDGYQPVLDCAADRSCVAISPDYESGRASTAVTYRGGQWSSSALSGDQVTDLDCADTECVAVGQSNGAPVVQRWRAGAWSRAVPAVPADAVAPARGSLAAVSCPHDGACVAVGSYLASGHGPVQLPFATTLTAGLWSAERVPVPEDGYGYARLGTALSCDTTRSCTLAGSYPKPSRFDEPGWDAQTGAFTATRDADGWHASAIALPDADPYSARTYLDEVACAAPGQCLVLGTYDLAASRTRGFVTTVRDGVVATPTHVASPFLDPTTDQITSAFPGFAGLAFDSPTTAVATARYRDADGSSRYMLLSGLGLGQGP